MAELLALAARLGYKWEDIEFPRNFAHPPAYGRQFAQLRAKLLEQAEQIYILNTTIRLRDPSSSGFLKYGFGPVTSAGCRTDGYERDFSFRVVRVDASGGDLSFHRCARVFVDDHLHPRQRVEDNSIAEWIFATTSQETHLVVVPQRLIGKTAN